MPIDYEYLKNPENRQSIRISDLGNLLTDYGFKAVIKGGRARWSHEDYPDLGLAYGMSNDAYCGPGTAKKASDLIDQLEARKMDAVRKKERPLPLPQEFNDHLKANIVDNGILLSYREFPEFNLFVRQSKFDDVSMTRSCRTLERDFRDAYKKWQDINSAFDIDVSRDNGDLVFRQETLDLETRCRIDKGSDFQSNVYNALTSMETLAVEMQQDRELEFMMLESYGYDVSPETDCIFVRDPGRSKDGSIRIETSFPGLMSLETKAILDELQARYPKPKQPGMSRIHIVETVRNVKLVPMTEEEVRLRDEAQIADNAASASLAENTQIVGQTATDIPNSVIATESLPESALQLPIFEQIPVEKPNDVQPPASENKILEPQLLPEPEPAVEAAPQPHSNPGPKARTPETRPGERIMAMVPDRPLSGADYENSFGGRIVRHRNERGMTEQVLADAICTIVKNGCPLDGDIVEAWQRNEAVPARQEEFDALSLILIDENDRISNTDKMAAKQDFQRRFRETKSALERGQVPGAENSFGQMVSRYRRQLGLTEDALSDRLVEKVDIKPTEDMKTFDFRQIARIQAGYHTPSPGLVNALMDVFGNDDGKYSFSPRDRQELLGSYLELQKADERLDRLATGNLRSVTAAPRPVGRTATPG